MKYLLLIFSVFIFSNCTAQGVLKRLPKPNEPSNTVTGNPLSSFVSIGSPVTISAWRLTAPIAGFMYPQNQVVTGLGYGYQRLRWIEATGKWYTNWSVSGVVYAGGNVTPSLSPNNIMSVGVSAGFLNQLINAGLAYNFPNGDKKGSIGIVFNVAMPLNN